MNSLFNAADFSSILERVEKLSPTSQRQWGKMDIAQMLAHCNVSLETAMGKHVVKPVFIGKIIGPLMKSRVLSEKPFGRNSPTDKSYIFKDERKFEEEKQKAIASLNEFHEGGPEGCTKAPHAFFGKFTPEQWGIFEWKHMDHHLRQFGV